MLKVTDSKYKSIYRGKVVDNNDPSKLGRIKVEVYPMFHEIGTNLLPWAVPAYPIWEGAGNGIGFFSVPRINSFVFVFFEGGDFNSPVYFAEAQTALFGLPAFKDTNYPNRKGWRTQAGVEFYVDDSEPEVKVTHPSGTTVTIDKDGNVIIDGVKDITANADKDINIHSKQNTNVIVEGSLNVAVYGQSYVTGTGVINISGSEVNLNP